MITLKGVVFGIGLSVFGTFAYVVFLIWHGLRGAELFQPGESVGFDITSLSHNTYLAPAYWVFVLGLILVGIGLVAMWPQSVLPPQ